MFKNEKETGIDIINEALKQTENIASPDPGSIMESNFLKGLLVSMKNIT